jgi:cysteine-rich repeat protein
VNFTATDNEAQQALCPVTLDVTSLCGDGNLDPGEACDDGNLDPGDCCSPLCLFEADGSVCGGGVPCSGPDTCQSGVCTPGAGAGDGDGDGTVDCLDNCPLDANADQSDIDGDSLGDVCDPADAAATVTHLKFKGDFSDVVDTGLVKVKGHFISLFAIDQLSATNGIAVRVRDQFENDASHFWPFSECKVSSTGRVKCVGADRTTKGVFKPLPPTPSAVIYSFKLKRLRSQAPFKEPLEVTVSYGPGIDRVGVITDCINKAKLIVCKEP